ncbi:hypothetical protein L1987_74412 [Smallanthus sonchifolius]|uniref:Uncharacterized protein n=1 Tax=Smallanthus sonchifolius TaxID=185202 RepID=A0ACB9A1W3_9ASTR|nr:hypothetical protein L1987_74412 [Smallanthus sonchifolius]
MHRSVRRAVIIGNGFAGAENQCYGLIRALGLSHRHSLYIQHPRSHLSRFDLVISPHHDYYPLTPEGKKQIPCGLLLVNLLEEMWWVGQRVLTFGALHQIDSDALQCAASAWHDELASLCKPLLVVNIGGPIRHCRYGADLARQLTTSLMNVLPTCGSIRISFSRRTPRQVSEILVKEFHNHPKVYIWDGQDPNPHMGHLAWADAFVITADSVSMLSEACTTG